MPSAVAPSASGISTKQRLGQGALAPTAPKEVGKVPPKPKPLLPTRKNSSSSQQSQFQEEPTGFPSIYIFSIAYAWANLVVSEHPSNALSTNHILDIICWTWFYDRHFSSIVGRS